MEGSLHPFLGSFGQFLFTKIKFSKFSDCKQHLLKFVSMLITEKKIFFVSICYPIMPKIWEAKKSIVRNMVSRFPHHWKGHLMSLGIHLVTFENHNSLVTSSFGGSLVHAICWKISKLDFSSHVFSTHPTNYVIGCKWW